MSDMTVERVRRKVGHIAQAAADGDYALARCLEADLFATALLSIADGARDPRAIAEEAMAARNIAFERFGP